MILANAIRSAIDGLATRSPERPGALLPPRHAAEQENPLHSSGGS